MNGYLNNGVNLYKAKPNAIYCPRDVKSMISLLQTMLSHVNLIAPQKGTIAYLQ